MKERTKVSKTLMICWLIHGKDASQVKACARRLRALQSKNKRMLKDLSNMSLEEVQAVMNNLLLYINN